MLNELKNIYITFRDKFSQGHSFPLSHHFPPPPKYINQKRVLIQEDAEMSNQSTYPRIGDPCLGVFKGRQEPHGQVMSHMQQFVIIILNCHVTKGLLGVSYYSVGRKEASQDPKRQDDKKNTKTIQSCGLSMHTIQCRLKAAASNPLNSELPGIPGTGLNGFLKFFPALINDRFLNTHITG